MVGKLISGLTYRWAHSHQDLQIVGQAHIRTFKKVGTLISGLTSGPTYTVVGQTHIRNLQIVGHTHIMIFK
jgi:hypothetical protein